jgi:hypothetical protein
VVDRDVVLLYSLDTVVVDRDVILLYSLDTIVVDIRRNPPLFFGYRCSGPRYNPPPLFELYYSGYEAQTSFLRLILL